MSEGKKEKKKNAIELMKKDKKQEKLENTQN